MQHHELKKYLEFTVNKKPDKMKKRTKLCIRTDRKFFKILLLKKDAQLVINDKTRTKFTFFENFSWGPCYRSLSQNDLNCFKNRLGTCGFADQQFFFCISNPERFFSSLKKTIVLYLVKKFETFMVMVASKALQKHNSL